MTMNAEFNMIGNQNPTFLVHFKPQFGDFTIKKSKSSDLVKCIQPKSNGVVSDNDTSVGVVETSVVKSRYFTANGFFSGKKISGLPSESPVASLIGGLLNGVKEVEDSILTSQGSGRDFITICTGLCQWSCCLYFMNDFYLNCMWYYFSKEKLGIQFLRVQDLGGIS
ncbi:hypothetical protein F0562_019917 [Nyssa sinensis]|uniref:Uncharacterized protein n=1 Tax=Nyssa sinensis TaxID=561372 RepID=A0A5J5BR92_9ASTE|nr:hypothetical protein F0562_019917 [Nyssa sinensis]